MNQHFSSRTTRLAALFVADGLFFGLTSPADVPSFALIIGFLLLVATLYQLTRGVLWLGGWYGFGRSEHRQRVARIITGVIGAAIALASMGQLSGRDIMVIAPLVVLAYGYFSYGRQSGRQVSTQEVTS